MQVSWFRNSIVEVLGESVVQPTPCADISKRFELRQVRKDIEKSYLRDSEQSTGRWPRRLFAEARKSYL